MVVVSIIDRMSRTSIDESSGVATLRFVSVKTLSTLGEETIFTDQ